MLHQKGHTGDTAHYQSGRSYEHNNRESVHSVPDYKNQGVEKKVQHFLFFADFFTHFDLTYEILTIKI